MYPVALAATLAGLSAVLVACTSSTTGAAPSSSESVSTPVAGSASVTGTPATSAEPGPVSASPSAANRSTTPAPGPARTSPSRLITSRPARPAYPSYRVTGTSSQALLTYFEQDTTVAPTGPVNIPWTHPAIGDFIKITAQAIGGDSITCEIIGTDGKVEAKQTSTGDNATATCTTTNVNPTPDHTPA
jgi:hypothetical protein